MKKNKKKNSSRFLTVFVAIIAAIIAKAVVNTTFTHKTSSYKQQNIQRQIDSLDVKMNKELDRFNNTEELHNYVGTKLKDSEIAVITAPMGFFMQADVVKEFCTPTGYVPEKYINRINSYKTDHNLDEEFIEFFNKKELNKEQTELLLRKTKEVAAQQLKRFIENDFLLLLKTEPSYTKKDYCKIYDIYTDDIISDKFKELDRTIPHEYKKYFRK